MKMKKILSVVAAFALSISAFSTVAMAEDARYGAPEVTVNFVRSGSYLDLEVGYTGFENFETYVNNRGNITGKGIGAITIYFDYDESKVTYDGGEKKISVGLTEIGPSGSEYATIAGTYTGDATQTSATNAHIATLWFSLKDANFDPEVDSVDFKITRIEFTVCDLSGATADQIYGNTNAAKVPMDLQTFTYGTASQGGGETGTAMVAGKDITEGFYAGKTSVSTPDAYAVDGIAKIRVSNDTKGEAQVQDLPVVLGSGKTKVLTVIVYDKAVMAGTTFTVEYLSEALEVLKTYTYQVAN